MAHDDDWWLPKEIPKLPQTPEIPGIVELPLTDVLDLHSFRPEDVKDVVRDYLDACHENGLLKLRIIHGKGIGVLRHTVRTLLQRDRRVIAFGDAPADAGGHGATWVTLAPRDEKMI